MYNKKKYTYGESFYFPISIIRIYNIHTVSLKNRDETEWSMQCLRLCGANKKENILYNSPHGLIQDVYELLPNIYVFHFAIIFSPQTREYFQVKVIDWRGKRRDVVLVHITCKNQLIYVAKKVSWYYADTRIRRSIESKKKKKIV